jgi:hypothetical protein
MTYVYIDGVAYEKGSEAYYLAKGAALPGAGSAPAVLADQPDFVSPLDGKLYSGRAGMRDHNARHNVVSNRDLVGLPTLTANSDFRSTEQKRADADNRKRLVINQVNKHYK